MVNLCMLTSLRDARPFLFLDSGPRNIHAIQRRRARSPPLHTHDAHVHVLSWPRLCVQHRRLRHTHHYSLNPNSPSHFLYIHSHTSIHFVRQDHIPGFVQHGLNSNFDSLGSCKHIVKMDYSKLYSKSRMCHSHSLSHTFESQQRNGKSGARSPRSKVALRRG